MCSGERGRCAAQQLPAAGVDLHAPYLINDRRSARTILEEITVSETKDGAKGISQANASHRDTRQRVAGSKETGRRFSYRSLQGKLPAPIQIVDQQKRWEGDTMHFSFTGKMGFFTRR